MGDGPAAMITCIKLSLLGVKHLTLVGPRIGNYIRSGEFNREVFEQVNAAISPLTITIPNEYGSSANYIRNLEKQLYAYVQQLNINCIRKKFETCVGHTLIKLINPLDLTDSEIIAADLVFDCTGSKRAVIKNINQTLQQPAFQITPLSDFSFTFAMARFDYSLKDGSGIKWAKNTVIEDLSLLLKLHRLGWPFFVLPVFYHFDWESSNSKQNLYFQCPDNATPDDVQKMATLMEDHYSLHFNNEKIDSIRFFHAPSKKHPDKKITSTFKFAPRLTTPCFYPGDQLSPFVIPLGDSLLDVPFIFAESLITFTKVLKQLASSLIIENAVITAFDLNYEQQVEKQLTSPINKIKEGLLKLAERNAQGSIFEEKQRMF